MQSPIKLYKYQFSERRKVASGVYRVRFEREEFDENAGSPVFYYKFRILGGEFEGEVVFVRVEDEVWPNSKSPAHGELYYTVCELTGRLVSNEEYIDADLDCIVGSRCYIEVDEQGDARVVISFRQQGGAK